MYSVEFWCDLYLSWMHAGCPDTTQRAIRIQDYFLKCLKLLSCPLTSRLAQSLYISHSTKSDIHGIIVNPTDGGGIYCLMEYKLLSVPHSGKKVIQSS